MFRVISVFESSCTAVGSPRIDALICVDRQNVHVKNHKQSVPKSILSPVAIV